MKKIALLLLAAAFAFSPAVAASKKKATTKEYNSNEASWRFVKDGFPLVLPTWALPVYFNYFHKKPDEKGKKK